MKNKLILASLMACSLLHANDTLVVDGNLEVLQSTVLQDLTIDDRILINGKGTDGSELLRFNMAREWAFQQQGEGSSSSLVLRSLTNAKRFNITAPDGTNLIQYYVFNEDQIDQARVTMAPVGGHVIVGSFTTDELNLPRNANARFFVEGDMAFKPDSDVGIIFADGTTLRSMDDIAASSALVSGDDALSTGVSVSGSVAGEDLQATLAGDAVIEGHSLSFRRDQSQPGAPTPIVGGDDGLWLLSDPEFVEGETSAITLNDAIGIRARYGKDIRREGGIINLSAGDSGYAKGGDVTIQAGSSETIGVNADPDQDYTGGDIYLRAGDGTAERGDLEITAENVGISGDLFLSGNAVFLGEVSGNFVLGEGSATPSEGALRYNSTSGDFEGYDGTAWSVIGGATGTITSIGDPSASFTLQGSKVQLLGARAEGSNSVAWGSGSYAHGASSTAGGTDASAWGDFSLAHGFNVYSDARYSVALGINCFALGEASVAIGSFNQALGNAAIALGEWSEASSYAQTVVGLYNAQLGDATSIGDIAPEDPVFIVGNGDDPYGGRSNALVIRKSGDMEVYGDATVAGGLAVGVSGIVFDDGSTLTSASALQSTPQELALNGSTLSISGGNSVDLGAVSTGAAGELASADDPASVGVAVTGTTAGGDLTTTISGTITITPQGDIPMGQFQ